MNKKHFTSENSFKEISSHLETTLEINARAMPYICIDSKLPTITILKRAVTDSDS